jgi:hypothetical protein
VKLAVCIAVILVSGIARAQPPAAHDLEPGPREAEAPYIDLLTFGVGERIFEKYGHAALCLRYHDPKHVPICFNFGVTDFDKGLPLVWSFVRGEQEFWTEPSTYGAMYGFYRWEDRDIWLQTLPVTGDQARELERELWASLGDNSRYHYDHFFNNCSTRLRDLIDKATNGKLAVGANERYPFTFRELGRRGLVELPPLLVITDFIIGRQADDRPTRWEAMFHPGIFRTEIERSLGVAPQLLYQREGYTFPEHGSSGRLEMLAIALVFALPLLLARVTGRARRSALGAAYAALLAYVLLETMPVLWAGLGAISLAAPALGVIGFVLPLWPKRAETATVAWATLHLAFWGFVVWGLAVVSTIDGVTHNEAMLVVMPFDVILPFLRPAWRRRYAQVRVALVVLASLACALGILRQPLWLPILVVFLPMAVLAFTRPAAASAPPAS